MTAGQLAFLEPSSRGLAEENVAKVLNSLAVGPRNGGEISIETGLGPLLTLDTLTYLERRGRIRRFSAKPIMWERT